MLKKKKFEKLNKGEIVIYLAPLEPVIWIVIALAFNAWHNSGGFMAWKPSNIRMFMENAKGLGL